MRGTGVWVCGHWWNIQSRTCRNDAAFTQTVGLEKRIECDAIGLGNSKQRISGLDDVLIHKFARRWKRMRRIGSGGSEAQVALLERDRDRRTCRRGSGGCVCGSGEDFTRLDRWRCDCRSIHRCEGIVGGVGGDSRGGTRVKKSSNE